MSQHFRGDLGEISLPNSSENRWSKPIAIVIMIAMEYNENVYMHGMHDVHFQCIYVCYGNNIIV